MVGRGRVGESGRAAVWICLALPCRRHIEHERVPNWVAHFGTSNWVAHFGTLSLDPHLQFDSSCQIQEFNQSKLPIGLLSSCLFAVSLSSFLSLPFSLSFFLLPAPSLSLFLTAPTVCIKWYSPNGCGDAGDFGYVYVWPACVCPPPTPSPTAPLFLLRKEVCQTWQVGPGERKVFRRLIE